LTLCIVDIRGNVKYPKKNPNSDFIALNHLSIGIHLLIAILFSLSSSATKKNEVQFVGIPHKKLDEVNIRRIDAPIKGPVRCLNRNSALNTYILF
jgi:hypothetical protein